MTTAVVLGIVCGALAAMLVGAAVVIRIMSGWILDAANRYRLNVLEYAQKIADEKAQKTAPKPDAAKECGIKVPPRFDEQPMRKPEQKHRKGKHKVVIVFSHGA